MHRKLWVSLVLIFLAQVGFAETKEASIASLEAALKQVDPSVWKTYGESLKNCTPNSYTLPNPVAVSFLKMIINLSQLNLPGDSSAYTKENIQKSLAALRQRYTIQGFKDNQCVVEISQMHEDGKSETLMTCRFEKADLQALGDKMPTMFDGLSANAKWVLGVMAKSCK